MTGWYELNTNDTGKFSFVLKAPNDQVILRSELYESKASAQNGIASVRKNCSAETHFEKKAATDGRPFFNLTSPNRQVIGTSQMYGSPQARDDGIASVMSCGTSATIKDRTK